MLNRSFIALGALAILLWLAVPFLPLAIGFDLPTSLNELGDSFGTVTALFSALAFLGVVYSLHLQRQEIIGTADELARQSKALADQTEALRNAVTAQKEQADSLRAQIAELGRNAQASEEQARQLTCQVYEQGYWERRRRLDQIRAARQNGQQIERVEKGDDGSQREMRQLLGDDYRAAIKGLLAYLDRMPDSLRGGFLDELKDDLTNGEKNTLFNAEFRPFPDDEKAPPISVLGRLLARHQMVGEVAREKAPMRSLQFFAAWRGEP